MKIKRRDKRRIKVFLDSGAFTAWSQGESINIKKYIKFIKKYASEIDHYSVLDDITNPEITLKNQKIMERAGLTPLPCYHYGEPFKYLKHYVKNYDYVSLGGMVPIKTPQLVPWLDRIFTQYICDDEGFAKLKVHGFGLASFNLMMRYPWYSVDSSGWILEAGRGAIIMPQTINGRWDYGVRPLRINVSNRLSGDRGVNSHHYENLPKNLKTRVDRYIAENGFVLGKSKFKKVDQGYELSAGEKFLNTTNKTQVETVIKEGLQNQSFLRIKFNILYVSNLQNKMPPYSKVRLKIKNGGKGFFV